ncbi:carboxypeptidase regulatory-like domain-containing protein [Candidatus Brocadia pituitae]|nr:carboxypeptidase regulatory-like domain-containing protein [Candidatus Brocadia pituitae]
MKRNLFQLFCIRQPLRITAACVLLIVLLIYTNTESKAAASLPEFYGVYITDRGKLIELGPTTPEKDKRNFSGSLNIIYFGEPPITPGIELHRRAFVRSQIEYLVDKPEQKPKEVRVKRVENFIVLNEKLHLRFKPVREQPGMVIAVPAQTLVPGLYAVTITGLAEVYKFPFSVGLDNTSEKDSPYNNCLDEHIRKVNRYPSLESSYIPCSVLDQMVVDWRMATLNAIDQEQWEDAITNARLVLAVNPGDNELSSLVHNRLVNAALQALDHKDWETVISFATKALKIKPGEQQATAILQQAKQSQVAAERSGIIAALQSSYSFFGAAESSNKKKYPFKITFESFDEHSNRVIGKMDYYSPDNKAILSFEGSLAGSTLRLQHTGVVRKGGFHAEFPIHA